MTTIAYKDGLLAADTLITCNGSISGYSSKLYELPNGAVIASAGNTRYLAWMQRALQALPEDFQLEHGVILPIEPPARLADDMRNMGIFIVRADGICFEIDEMIAYQLEAPFHTQGSGGDYAAGAMAAGLDAVEAVKIAAELDTATGGVIDFIRFPRNSH